MPLCDGEHQPTMLRAVRPPIWRSGGDHLRGTRASSLLRGHSGTLAQPSLLLPECFYIIWPCANPVVRNRVGADLGLVDADDVGDEASAEAAPAPAIDYPSHSSRAVLGGARRVPNPDVCAARPRSGASDSLTHLGQSDLDGILVPHQLEAYAASGVIPEHLAQASAILSRMNQPQVSAAAGDAQHVAGDYYTGL